MKLFYQNWKRKTKLEERAIKSLLVAKKLILNNIPKKQIIAIYAFGSFVRREMNEKSDVDIKVILKESHFVRKMDKLENKYKNKFKPDINISSYSLWELKTGKRLKTNKLKTPSSKFLKRLDDFELIYGKKPNVKEFKLRKDVDDFKGMIWAFKKLFLPGFKKGKFGFQGILKQIFWLTEYELRIQNKKPPHSWKKMAKLLPKNHIMNEALKLRKLRPKDKKTRKNFIRKIEHHIKKLVEIE